MGRAARRNHSPGWSRLATLSGGDVRDSSISGIPSGHSTFSASAAEVLKRFSGSDVLSKSMAFKAGSSVFEQGAVPTADVMLSWSSFSEMAEEAGISRRYGGIHFTPADIEGRKLGRQVGAAVWEQAQRYISGSIAEDTSGKWLFCISAMRGLRGCTHRLAEFRPISGMRDPAAISSVQCDEGAAGGGIKITPILPST